MENKLELEIIYEKMLNSFGKFPQLKAFLLFFSIVFYLAIPGTNIPVLEFSNVRFSGVMEQRLMSNFFFYYPKQDWVSYENISDYFKYGVITMEDGLFIEHKGIEWNSLWESLRANERRGKVVRGGSTISMQLVKNIYFTTRRSYFRKAKELLVTMRMEKEISKKRILEQYMNIIETGAGIFGVEACSEKFFGKSSNKVSRDEAARIIAVIPSPIKHKPTDNKGFTSSRKEHVLSRMYQVLIP